MSRQTRGRGGGGAAAATLNNENSVAAAPAAAALARPLLKDRGAKDLQALPGKGLDAHATVKGVANAKQRGPLNSINQQPQPTTKVLKPRMTRSQTAKTNSKVGVAELKELASKTGSKKKVESVPTNISENDAENVEPEQAPAPAPAKIAKNKVSKTANDRTAGPIVPPKTAEPSTSNISKEAEAETTPATLPVEDQWDDLDADDVNDPMMVSEYVTDIFEYMRELELTVMPNPNYIENQKELDWHMRAVLVDWLVDIHTKFRLLPETLYLAVNIIDRFLSLRVVSSIKIQLVGVAAMLIASKYEEVVPPSVKNFIYVTDDGYTEDEILRAERYILSVLDYNLQYQSPMSFLRRCSKAEHYDIQTRTLAKYLMEISLVDHQFLDVPPSAVAGAGLFLARKMLRRGPWDKNLVHYSGYTAKELEKCVQLTLHYLDTPTNLEALFKKYSGKKYMKASIFVKDWMKNLNEKNDD